MVLDEVDRLVDMGFAPQITAILDEFRARGVPREQYRTIVTSVRAGTATNATHATNSTNSMTATRVK